MYTTHPRHHSYSFRECRTENSFGYKKREGDRIDEGGPVGKQAPTRSTLENAGTEHRDHAGEQ